MITMMYSDVVAALTWGWDSECERVAQLWLDELSYDKSEARYRVCYDKKARI